VCCVQITTRVTDTGVSTAPRANRSLAATTAARVLLALLVYTASEVSSKSLVSCSFHLSRMSVLV